MQQQQLCAPVCHALWPEKQCSNIWINFVDSYFDEIAYFFFSVKNKSFFALI